MKRIHITTEDSWICNKLAHSLADLEGFRVRVTTDPPRDADLTYYVTYLFREMYKPVGRSIGMFTHYVPGKHQRRYDMMARQVDHCVALSEQHQNYLSKLVGELKVTRVHMPVLQTSIVPPLKVGWFHRSPGGYGDRKRVDLLEPLRTLPWIKLVQSDGGMKTDQLHAAMRDVDVFLTTSDYEAGPVSFLEGLTLGKHVVIPSGVGLADEYTRVSGVHLFPPGDAAAMIRVLETIYAPLKDRYEAVMHNTIENWRLSHAAIFRKVLR